MRAIAIAILTLCLGACSQGDKNLVPVTDDRFDLISLHMPDLLAKDAKQCISVNRPLRGMAGAQDAISEEFFEKILDFWQVVDAAYVSGDEAYKVLPSGGNPEKVASILPKMKLPGPVAHACGEYAGQVAVKIGLMSLSDSIDSAINENPEIFKDMGVDIELIRANLSVIEARVSRLRALSVDERVQCVAIYEAARVSDDSLEQYRVVWAASLVDAIETGALDPNTLRERSVYWQALADGGASAVVSTEGFKEQASKCDVWINDAFSEEVAE